MSKSVKVTKLPTCDICVYVCRAPNPQIASHDGKTKGGPWANMCESHFKSHGTGLGTGRGQRLVLEVQ